MKVKIIVAVLLLSVIGFALSLLYSWRSPGLPRYTEGYFPFTIVYAIDGVERTVSGSVHVEFWRSLRGNMMMSPRRDWNTVLNRYVGNVSILSDWIVLEVRDEGNIEFITANGSYLMGDPFRGIRWMERQRQEIPFFYSWRFVLRNPSGLGFAEEVGVQDAEDFLSQFGIELIYMNIPQPIHNVFGR